MIYNNSKLLKSWLGKEFIKGRIGLYVDYGTNADFSSFKVSSAIEAKN